MANEKPIIFSTPMVKAILEGKKTMTRRVIKPQFRQLWGYGTKIGEDRFSCQVDIPDPVGGWKWLYSFWGIGMRLWVRETWRVHHGDDGTQCFEYKADAADNLMPPWRPSIFMPHWASRITLEVTELKVERVQDITESDAIAEGVQSFNGSSYTVPALGQFATLWHNLNAKRGYGWDVNPWVWVVSFKRVQNG